MKIIAEPISKDKILKEHNSFFQTMIKAVVDIEKRIIALDAELHADLEAQLLHQGSDQKDLWGVNMYLNKPRDEWIEYTAFINIRPSMGNRDMEVKDSALRKQIEEVVFALITE
jgi:hypothetical protein